MPQLALTGAVDSPTMVHEQRTGRLMSPSSLASLSRSTKPENAVSVKFGKSTMPNRKGREAAALERDGLVNIALRAEHGKRFGGTHHTGTYQLCTLNGGVANANTRPPSLKGSFLR